MVGVLSLFSVTIGIGLYVGLLFIIQELGNLLHCNKYSDKVPKRGFSVLWTEFLVTMPCNCVILLQIPSFEELNEKLKMYMAQYNETVRGGSMDLVFFKDAMVHLIKVTYLNLSNGHKT